MRTCTLALASLALAGLTALGTAHLVQADDAGSQPRAKVSPAEHPHCAIEQPKPKAAEKFDGKTAEQWREEGPAGLAELMQRMQPTIQACKAAAENAKGLSLDKRADLLLLDQVAQQRDAFAAGLYWYTDLDAALAEAQRVGKPVISLRMLGKLVDEYSCANSRFFRTTLYADESVSKMLRESFVLHWQSVRPVPVITIDMGDGRAIKRTITGNSAHYVLDPKGRVVDCLPGLYGAGTFERLAGQAGENAMQLTELDDEKFKTALAYWHNDRAISLSAAWLSYMKALYPEQIEQASQTASKPVPQINAVNSMNRDADLPDAHQAGRVAFGGKFKMEKPMLDAMLGKRPTAQAAHDDMALWNKIAQAYAKEAKLDEGSRSLMVHKTPQAKLQRALEVAPMKAEFESPVARMIRNFQNGVALETARNEHLLHARLHDWFAKGEASLAVDQLNKRVYAELFLTPDEDPWLGLVPADAYSALDGGGLSN